MFKPSTETIQGIEIKILGPYRPWSHHREMGGDGSNYPEHSGRILDVKDGKAGGIKYFADYMIPKIITQGAVSVVPSHNPDKAPGGLHSLANQFVGGCGLIDASTVLVRHTKIDKLATGGDRSIQVHLGSVHIPDPGPIHGRIVLLLDDVMTTGNSLLACRQLLLEAGAAEVRCVALGYTS